MKPRFASFVKPLDTREAEVVAAYLALVPRAGRSCMAPRYGHPAPEFSLPSTLGRTVTLGEFKGKADVVLAFFCYAWGGI
jgi:hypothetical protein